MSKNQIIVNESSKILTRIFFSGSGWRLYFCCVCIYANIIIILYSYICNEWLIICNLCKVTASLINGLLYYSESTIKGILKRGNYIYVTVNLC